MFGIVADQPNPRVGEVLAGNLRRLRIARHLSLSELARATAISKATLSSIENARANPTVETLASLAQALRVSLSELLEELPLGEVLVVRATASGLETRGDLRTRTVTSAASFELVEVALSARQTRELEPDAAGYRKHVYVLHGKLITGPVERITELGAGDYASFPANVPHVYETGRHPARALVLSAPGP